MYRERAAGMYDELPFAVAQCLVELPYNLIQAFLFALISYWMLGFENNAGARQNWCPRPSPPLHNASQGRLAQPKHAAASRMLHDGLSR